MNIFTVSFFGQKEITDLLYVETALEKEVRDLIMTKEYVEFLVGRQGEFDMLVSSTIRRVKRELDYGNTSLVLVLPRLTAEYRKNRAGFEKFYDEIEICTESENVSSKRSRELRNKTVADRSDLIICCIDHENGEAYKTMIYAEKQNINVKNVAG